MELDWSDETCALLQDRSSIGDSGYTERTLSGGGEMTGDEEAQWWEKAPGWLQVRVHSLHASISLE